MGTRRNIFTFGEAFGKGTDEQIQIGSNLGRAETTFGQIRERIDAVAQAIQEFVTSLIDMNDMGESVAAASEEQATSMGEIARNAEGLSILGRIYRKSLTDSSFRDNEWRMEETLCPLPLSGKTSPKCMWMQL